MIDEKNSSKSQGGEKAIRPDRSPERQGERFQEKGVTASGRAPLRSDSSKRTSEKK